MVFRNPLLCGMLVIAAISATCACAQDAEAKGKKSRGSYFVPPPPAYTPSLTPAVYVNGQPQVAEVKKKKKKKEAEEKKYVYTREGYEQPKATKPNPYVTYWGS